MIIKPVCGKCKTDLEIKDTFVSAHARTVIIEVAPCTNMNCYDCSKCDEKLKLKNSDLHRHNVELQAKLNRIAGEAVR